MNKQERTAYEELYKEYWERQVKRDVADNSKLREMSGSSWLWGRNGLKGGRPELELTKKAAAINRMLKLGMPIQNICETLQTTDKSVIQIKARYNLPREETKEN